MCGQDLLTASTRERRSPREHLVYDGAERVEIRAVVGRGIGRRLLGRHVRRGPESDADAREGGAAGGRVQRFRDAEVRDQGMAAGQEHVVWLDVAVDDAMPVRIPQRVGYLAGDRAYLVDWELRLTGEALPQALALDVRHHVIHQAGGDTRIVEWDDVLVGEAGRDLDLAQEPLRTEGGRELGLQDFDSDATMVLPVVGHVDRRHPPAAEFALDRVAPGEGGLK